MMNEDLCNLKGIYLDLYNSSDYIIDKLDDVKNNINIIRNNILDCYMINDCSGDNEILNNNLQDIDSINIFLKNNVNVEILDKLIEINQQINSL